ncbi:MAG: heparin lyase I family protein [Anaerolineaceae bacterium]
MRTTPTTTTTPTLASLFSGNWDTGDVSQWSGSQCAGDISNGIARGTYAIVSSPVAQGTFSANFELPAASVANACEVYHQRTVATGTDDYYAFDLMFPTNWQEPSPAGWGMLVGQLNYVGWLTGVGPPIGISAHAGKLVMVLLSGNSVGGVPTYSTGPDNNGVGARCGTVTCQIIPQGQLTLGVWHQIVVHVHWATDSTGKVDSWWRRKGEAVWNPEAYITGVPTLQWINNSPYPSSQTSYDKIGAYRGAAIFPLSVRNDGFCRATTFVAAAACS